MLHASSSCPTHSVYVIHMFKIVSGDYFPIHQEQIGNYNGYGLCILWGRHWIFVCMTVFPKTDKTARCSILSTIKPRKAVCISHIFRRNCHLKHVFVGKTEGTGRRRRRRTELLDGLKKGRRCLNFKDKALDDTVWRTYLEAIDKSQPDYARMNEWMNEQLRNWLNNQSSGV